MLETPSPPLPAPRPGPGYAAVFWAAASVALLGALLEPLAGYRAVGFLFLLFVLGLGLLVPLGPVIFGALLSALIWDLGFIPPRFSFSIGSGEDGMLLIAYLATAACIGALTARLRRMQQASLAQAETASLMAECAAILEQGGASPAALQSALRHAEQRLGLRLGLALTDAQGALPRQALAQDTFLLGATELAQAEAALRTAKPLGWEQAASFAPRLLTLPLDLGQGAGGVLLCRRAEEQRVGAAERAQLASLAALLGAHLQRRSLRERSAEAESLRASEALHQALFDSVSHELRTPLTAMLAGANALQSPAADDPGLRQSLAQDLAAAGERLNQTIGNLLDSARLSAGRLELRRDWQDPGDLLRGALQRLQPALARHRIELQLGQDLPLLQVDHRLIEHALANLLLNAAAYAPEGSAIRLSAQAQGPWLRLSVADEGPGIPAASLDKVFERFYRLPGSPAGGTGLGLHIARSLIRAHEGELVALPAAKGSCFEIRLPIPPAPPAAVP